jgi:hypothetical protein
MATVPALQVDGDLSMRHYGVTSGPASTYAEAARVCLDRHHQPPVTAQIETRGLR